ncbi:MAG: DUF2244 domain-containing protein [Halioglobus sp.]|nr:DUF2244 domain-containing protein [Halioglobus sp.]
MAQPDHSSSWRNNMLVLAALAVPSLGAAIMFSLAGAWPILPLASLELTALGVALYLVNRKLHYRHVITLNGNTVTVDKGYHSPLHRWRFARDAAGLSIVDQSRAGDSPEITLHDRSDRVSLGEFLGREDSLALIELLRGELSVRANSGGSEKTF